MSKTPISILQEFMVKKQNILPTYIESPSDKDGFNFACVVHAGNVEAKGYGTNKKEAKQDSAYQALVLLNFPLSDEYKSACTRNVVSSVLTPCTVQDINSIGIPSLPSDNYVGKLNEYASMHGKQYPVYIESIIALNGRFIVQCQFENLCTDGYGLKKKTAKQDSAMKMFELVKDENIGANMERKSFQDDKMENINRLSEAMMTKYAEMSINEEGIVRTPISNRMPHLNVSVDSLEELLEELEKYGHRGVVKTFQKDPYIVKLRLEGTTCIMMGHGSTEEEAREDLLIGASIMLRNGYPYENMYSESTHS